MNPLSGVKIENTVLTGKWKKREDRPRPVCTLSRGLDCKVGRFVKDADDPTRPIVTGPGSINTGSIASPLTIYSSSSGASRGPAEEPKEEQYIDPANAKTFDGLRILKPTSGQSIGRGPDRSMVPVNLVEIASAPTLTRCTEPAGSVWSCLWGLVTTMEESE